MNKDVFPVAEFSWELQPNEVVQISRKSRSDPPDFHLQLGGRGDDTVPLTSTPKIVDPINVPLSESPGVLWESTDCLVGRVRERARRGAGDSVPRPIARL